MSDEKKELKNKIKEKLLKGYKLKTNFRSSDFFVEVGNFIIIAKPVCSKEEVKYEFLLDIQFLSGNEINYEELKMLKNVLEVLEQNRDIAISSLKKWTVATYLKDQKMRKLRNEAMLEALKTAWAQKNK